MYLKGPQTLGLGSYLKSSDFFRIIQNNSSLLTHHPQSAQSCLTLCDLMDYSLSGFSIHGIFQASILEWVAISFSRGSY